MKISKKNSLLVIWAALSFTLLAVPFSLAHGVGVFAYPEGDNLVGEGYFSGGGKTRNCPVILQDKDGRVLAETKTDGEGRFSLPMPKAGPPLLLILNAGQGHRAEYSLTADDLGSASSAETPPAPKSAAAEPPSKDAKSAEMKVTFETNAQIKAMVEQAVTKSVSAQLRGTNARLDRLAERHGPGISEIIGGLGWIMGLVGIAAFFKAREKHKR